jgi:hypothetical protein
MKPPTKPFKVRFSLTTLKDLEEFASQDGRSLANAVRKIVEDFLKAWRAKQ